MSRRVQLAPDNAMSWSRVDPDTRRQTWVQVCDVNSGRDGSFSCDITFKEKDPSFQKPLSGGYSLTRPLELKLQWQSNGQLSGTFRRYFTYGTDAHDGSFFIDETAVRSNWVRKYKGFPKEFTSTGGQCGVYRIWGAGAPANSFLGSMVATITVMDKCRRF